MTTVEVFLDEMPGETRGIIARDGRFEHLLIQRDTDIAVHRLGARMAGRITQADPAFGGAYVELGSGGVAGFLPNGAGRVREGEVLEVEVIAEPRGQKGPTLRRVGSASGEPQLLSPGPGVRAMLARLAPGIEPITGLTAVQASWDAEEEALADGYAFAEFGLNLAVQRTRALVAVDVDYAHVNGRDARKGRARANREGLKQAARLIRLKRWGGLVVVDLVGAGLDGAQVTADARAAFTQEGDRVAFGPLSRFGLFQLSLPWGAQPIEELLGVHHGAVGAENRALSIIRRLNHARLSDPSVPRFTAVCPTADAVFAEPLARLLGPRTAVRADDSVRPGHEIITED